ncbi:hypothetical protein EVAR_16533_1 [Eumeta japonica]|uniref:Uncharacterized protein n=1 Tax=Eumeta variegata TaxID=151549 RepID=A0A4C1U320_EUMVA|nr:hypothetical protein EVAR_16533_1 [Eumeta japonica]
MLQQTAGGHRGERSHSGIEATREECCDELMKCAMQRSIMELAAYAGNFIQSKRSLVPQSFLIVYKLFRLYSFVSAPASDTGRAAERMRASCLKYPRQHFALADGRRTPR